VLDVLVLRDRDGAVIRPCGSITAATSSRLAIAFATLLAETSSVVLDLSSVTALDADRVWVISEAARLFRDRGTSFTVRNATAAVGEALDTDSVAWERVGGGPQPQLQ
jgi:anti-anti-sigma regulatory factor